MKTLGIRVVNNGHGKHLAQGTNTQVFVVQEDEAGEVHEVEISSVVRGVDATIRVGAVVTAKLDCFLKGFETPVDINEVTFVELMRLADR